MNTMISSTIRLLAVWAALTASPVLAQTINSSEAAEPYASTRGWQVYSMSDGRGIFSCRAVRGQGYTDQIMIEYDGFDETWRVLVHGRKPAGGGAGINGTVVYYDGRPMDRQIYFGLEGEDGSSNSHARLDLSESELGWLQSGSNMRIDINGEASRTWSLSGTTAAVLKTTECAGVFGFAPAGMAASAAPKVRQPAAQPQRAAVDGNSVGYVVHSAGRFLSTGSGNWVEEGNDGGVFYFEEYDRNWESVFLNDPSRNLQIWISLPYNEISYTENFNNRGWRSLYAINCFDREASRSC